MKRNEFKELVEFILGTKFENGKLLDELIKMDKAGKLDNKKMYQLVALLCEYNLNE